MRLSDWLVTRCCWWLAIIRNHTKKYFGDRLPVANCSECFDASFQSRREMWPEEFAAYSWDRWMRRNLLFFGRKCGVLCGPSSSERRHLFLPAPQTCTECENVLERCARRICSKICQPALTKTKYLRPIKGVSKVSNHATMGSISVVVSQGGRVPRRLFWGLDGLDRAFLAGHYYKRRRFRARDGPGFCLNG